MGTNIAGLILRAGDRQETARFYAALGLCANVHRHGGPIHHELGPASNECVIEVYARSPIFSRDALMLNVNSIDRSLQIAATFGLTARMGVRDMKDVRFVYIADPDERPLMLIEKK